MIRLKKVEEMVEVHYNSGQFANTMEHLVKEFPSPFDLYVELGEYYEKNGLFEINHSRLARYENLWQFIRIQLPDRADSYREWLTLDLYLRENVKNRPAFAEENQVTKEEMTALFDEFEAYESAESKFAHAMDNLQPLLLNHSNGGADWREHQVTAEQVYGRQSKTQKGSKRLYEVIDQLLRENIEKGNIIV